MLTSARLPSFKVAGILVKGRRASQDNHEDVYSGPTSAKTASRDASVGGYGPARNAHTPLMMAPRGAMRTSILSVPSRPTVDGRSLNARVEQRPIKERKD